MSLQSAKASKLRVVVQFENFNNLAQLKSPTVAFRLVVRGFVAGIHPLPLPIRLRLLILYKSARQKHEQGRK